MEGLMKLGIPNAVGEKPTNPKDHAATTRIPLWLCSAVAKAHWAVAQFAGLLKYGAWNWRAAGVRTSVYLSAMQRHIDAYTNGEELDPIDGTHHLGNIMACAAILLDAKAAGKLIDDRPPSVTIRPTYAQLEGTMGKLIEQYKDKDPRHWSIADTGECFPPPEEPPPARRTLTIPIDFDHGRSSGAV